MSGLAARRFVKALAFGLRQRRRHAVGGLEPAELGEAEWGSATQKPRQSFSHCVEYSKRYLALAVTDVIRPCDESHLSAAPRKSPVRENLLIPVFKLDAKCKASNTCGGWWAPEGSL